jgi:hypothetical protein
MLLLWLWLVLLLLMVMEAGLLNTLVLVLDVQLQSWQHLTISSLIL